MRFFINRKAGAAAALCLLFTLGCVTEIHWQDLTNRYEKALAEDRFAPRLYYTGSNSDYDLFYMQSDRIWGENREQVKSVVWSRNRFKVPRGEAPVGNRMAPVQDRTRWRRCSFNRVSEKFEIVIMDSSSGSDIEAMRWIE